VSSLTPGSPMTPVSLSPSPVELAVAAPRTPLSILKRPTPGVPKSPSRVKKVAFPSLDNGEIVENDNNAPPTPPPAEADRIVDARKRIWTNPNTGKKTKQWYVRFGWKGYPDHVDGEDIWHWLHEVGNDEETKLRWLEDWKRAKNDPARASTTTSQGPSLSPDVDGLTKTALSRIGNRAQERRLISNKLGLK
jgi:hypothetical protein